MFEAGGASGGVEAADAAELLTARHARIAREQCLEIESVTDLFIVRCEEDARAGRNEARHGEFAHVEVAGILGLTESAAQRMIGLGCDLRWRLSRVRAAFAAGRIDLAKAHALAEILAKVSDEVLAEIEERLLDGADRTSTTRLRNRGRRLIARLDPEGTRERRRRAAADRDARVIARDDGMAEVDGLLPAAGGRILAGRLRRCVSTCAPRIRAPMRSVAPTHWSRSLRGTHTSTALAGATTAPPTRAFPRVTIPPPFGRLGAGPGRRRRVDTARARRRPRLPVRPRPHRRRSGAGSRCGRHMETGAHPHRSRSRSTRISDSLFDGPGRRCRLPTSAAATGTRRCRGAPSRTHIPT
nr:DUF222 domain-containing protein [Prescottella equi]